MDAQQVSLVIVVVVVVVYFDSACIYMLFNGWPASFFNYSGVYQEEPFLPILFSFGEEFFNWYIDGFALVPISSPQGAKAPSHPLFADNVLIFCRGNKYNLESFSSTLPIYYIVYY